MQTNRRINHSKSTKTGHSLSLWRWQLALWFRISWFLGALMRNSMNGNDTDKSFFFLKSVDIIRLMLSDMSFMKWHIKVNFAAYQVSNILGKQTQLTLKKPDRHLLTHPHFASGETTLGNMSACPMWSARRSKCPSSSGYTYPWGSAHRGCIYTKQGIPGCCRFRHENKLCSGPSVGDRKQRHAFLQQSTWQMAILVQCHQSI